MSISRWFFALALSLSFAAVVAACYSSGTAEPAVTLPTEPAGGREEVSPEARARLCPPAHADPIPQRQEAVAARPQVTFDDLRAQVRDACGSCHLSPAERGGFSFRDAYKGAEALVLGDKRFVPGMYEAAQPMAKRLAAGTMPPADIRDADPARYARLGQLLQAWIGEGRPAGSFPVGGPGEGGEGQRLAPEVAAAMTSLGDCVPAKELIGRDADKDAWFASATELPSDLRDTDLFTLDAYELAKHGTVAYAPTYPLWSDDAKKLRMIHVPSAPVRFDRAKGTFDIPDNTRLYKTFFKEVVDKDGRSTFRKIETRLIVRRTPASRSLFGTYRWNDAEDRATLVTTPYRSGEPFKDTVFSVEVDERTHATQKYAVPGRHRCVECHQGSESESFVLGFSPLQVHRRRPGEGGVEGPVTQDELTQVERLVAYGVLAPVEEGELPSLEVTGGEGRPRNDHELSAQAYVIGNCAHCHNPNGFASQQDPRLGAFNLSAGRLFQFPIGLRAASSGNLLVSAGHPEKSEIYARVANPTSLQGAVALQHMPLHTGGIDCRALDRIGRWIASIPISPGGQPTQEQLKKAEDEAAARAKSFSTGCTPSGDITWLEEDFTETPAYRPRRDDWRDPTHGLPPDVRAMRFTPELEKLAATPIAVGYWNKKPACRFPDVPAPEGGIRPWMTDSQMRPKRPYGEVFYQSAGSYYFAAVCQKCHGPRADGSSGVAKLLAQQTGGLVRVANLRDGLFGQFGKNVEVFDVVEDGARRNLAGNYLIWMASGATRVTFPPGFSELVGGYGGNMLRRLRDQFKRLLPGHPDPYPDFYQTYEVFQAVATLDNPIPPEAGYDAAGTPRDEAAQSAWLDRAQGNAGWMLFRFFRDQAAKGDWPLTPNQCEAVFPAK